MGALLIVVKGNTYGFKTNKTTVLNRKTVLFCVKEPQESLIVVRYFYAVEEKQHSRMTS